MLDGDGDNVNGDSYDEGDDYDETDDGKNSKDMKELIDDESSDSDIIVQ